MSKKITIQDVADAAGVSVGSVSNVLNDNSQVKASTETKIRKAIERLGYEPNVIARSMRTKSTRAIGFIVNDISNPLYSGIVKAVESTVKQHGYCMLLMNSENQVSSEVNLLTTMNSGRVDAVVSTVSNERDPDLVDALRNLKVPLILLDREVAVAADVIRIDYFSGVAKAVNYLCDLGHKNIVLLSGGQEIHPGRDFAAGFAAAMKARKLPVGANSIQSADLTIDFGYQATLRVCKLQSRPTALIAGGSRIFAGVLRALRELQIKVPDDLSVITCDDTDLTSLSTPSYTVLTRDPQKIGGAIAELLMRRLENKKSTPKIITLHAELLVRESCTTIKRTN